MRKRIPAYQAELLKILEYDEDDIVALETTTNMIFDPYEDDRLEPSVFSNSIAYRNIITLPTTTNVIAWLREEKGIFIKIPITNVKAKLISYYDLEVEAIRIELLELIKSKYSHNLTEDETAEPEEPDF